ncbi:MAG: PAC2 family protein [Ilumatobacteraceae bacterium]
MSEPYRISSEFESVLPKLDAALLVVMLSGWIDASAAAAAAMEMLIIDTNAKTLLTFDADEFIDFRARRPTMELREGINTKLIWSTPQLLLGYDIDKKPVLLLTGPEPDNRWQHFANVVADLAVELGVRRMLGIGAYPIATPHTRAVQVSCSSPSAKLIASLPYLKSSVDVPAGMEAALEHALAKRDIEALGLWAQVPHYVASLAYPAASAALLGAVCDSGEISLEISDIRQQAMLQRERLDQLVRANPEHAAMLSQLEREFDESHSGNGTLTTGFGGAPLPSGDELAAELEQFLRENQADS